MDHKEENKSLRTGQSSLQEEGNMSEEHSDNHESANNNVQPGQEGQTAAESHASTNEEVPETSTEKEETNEVPPGTPEGTDGRSQHTEGEAKAGQAQFATEPEKTGDDSTPEKNNTRDSEQPDESTTGQQSAEPQATPSEENTSKADASPEEVEKPEAPKEEAGDEAVNQEQTKGEETRYAEEDTEKEEKSAPKETKKTEARREMPDYNTYSKEELAQAFEQLLGEKDLYHLRSELETIRSIFFKKRNDELEALKEAFQNEGGDPLSFQAPEDETENKFKELYRTFKSEKKRLEREQEEQKHRNLEASEQIIRELKELVNTQESLGKTFHDFKELQQRWREIGPVPQNKYKELWVRYNHSIEKFYDYVKINKELKELDLKKNLEAKKELCEKAEDLLLEEDVVKAYKSLQTLHDRWREIGPVPKEKKDELWERFKAATKQINKRHQEHFEKLKAEREKNLEAKTLLCQKAEELSELEIDTHKEWEARTKEIKQLQEIWRSIGFVPKKYNNKIYQRFRAANDAFFNKKREFYANLRKEQQENLKLKRELLQQAEEMQESTDWKTATAFYKDIQEKWKHIGPVPKKHSDIIWKKFRAACNHFFDRKRAHFSDIDQKQEENLKLKQELIQEVKAFEPSDDDKENLQKVKEFQDRWSEIGFVPIQQKDEIQKEFSDAINDLYEKLQVDDRKLVDLKYKNRIENLKNSPKSDAKLRGEREKIANKLKKIENDITVWENNIGFFTSSSQNAQSYIDEMEKKIDEAKKLANKLKSKLDIIDEMSEE